MPVYIIVIMAVIVAALAVYALRLCWLLWQQRQRSARQKVENQQQLQARHDEARASIDIIVRCLLQDQVSLTEASIRVSGLAKSLAMSDVERQFFTPFDELAQATSHIPILDAWKQLDKQQKKQFDKERGHIEQQYQRRVLDAAQQLTTLQ